MTAINITKIESPAYVCDEAKLVDNLKVLADVQREADCKIVLALKGFAMWGVFPIIKEYLPGVAASSVNEARLGYEEFGGEVHYYSPAIKESEIDDVIKYSNHIAFNSQSQLRQFREKALAANKKIGLRINPECSVVTTDIYNPCVKYSRLGITYAELDENDLEGVTGLHFHALCENSADDLEVALNSVTEKFGNIIEKMEWVNFGGGHHITRPGYNVEKLVKLVLNFKEKYKVNVILEPGEAIALNAGVLVASVIDITRNEIDIAILDVSAAAHMPDVLEMPYRPEIFNSAKPGELDYTYRLAGATCLAGDIIGDYSFDKPLQVGDKLMFADMMIYSMVKNTTFNGVPLPTIGIWTKEGEYKTVREFGYNDFKNRLS